MKLGLLDPTSHRSAILAASLGLGELATHMPPTCDYQAALNLGMDVPPEALGNDTLPDCVEAGYLRQLQMREANAMGSAWRPTAAEATALLTAWGDPALGTNLATAQARAARDGIRVGTADLDVPLPVIVPTRAESISFATWVFGSVGLCWALPAYLLANGDCPRTWDVAPPGTSDADQAPGDRHYTPSGAYTPTSRRIITWGLDVEVTPAFEARYLVGASAQLSRRWFDAHGVAVPGFDWAQVDAIRGMLA